MFFVNTFKRKSFLDKRGFSLHCVLQYIWNKTGLGTRVPVPWMNRNTVPSKSKIALEKK